MDATHDNDRTPDRRPFRVGILRFMLTVVILVGASRLGAQEPANPRPISPPNAPLNVDDESSDESSNGRSIGTTVAALGAILLLFLGLVQVWRRYSPQSSQSLPDAAWEILGSAPLDNRHQITIVRLGSRLLVLGRSDDGLQTLSEITSADEVSQLVALCQSAKQPAEKNSFRQLYDNFRSQIGASTTENTASASSSNGETRRA